MKFKIKTTKNFEKSLKKLQKSGSFKIEKLKKVLNLLIDNKKLPENFRDHQLKGKLKDFRECHLEPDLLLIYKKEDIDLVLILIDIGSHSSLS